MSKLFRLIQFSDSTFPVGTFSFSNGLETAAHLGLIHDAESLGQYAASVAAQSAFCDSVIALMAHRAASKDDYEGVLRADRNLIVFKMNDEARLMLTRMGKKFAELASRLYGDGSVFARWLGDINAGITPGVYPVAQALAFALEGLDEKELYISQQYAAINMALSAALRCARVSHYETQEILFKLGGKVEENYEQAREMGFNDINSFVPEIDIFASLHEKGAMRMFMN